MEAFVLLACLLALFGLQSFVFRRFGLRQLTYERRFSKKAVFPGETLQMVEVIRNAKPLPLPWLRVESRMSTAFRFATEEAEGDALHESTDDALHHRSVFYLAPFSKVTRSTGLRVMRRGYYAVGHVALSAGDLFAFSGQSVESETGAALCVYPRLLSADEIPLPSSRWQGDLAVRRWIVPDPFLVAGIRAFQQGDAMRDVHWAATARTGALQVKARDFTANPKLLVILNISLREGQWSDLMEYEQQPIEDAISVAATLCLRALQSGLEAGFAVNAPTGQDLTQTTVLPPARYHGRDLDLLECMARVRVHRSRNFHTFLEDFSRLQNTDLLVLSAYHSELMEQSLQALRRRGNAVMVMDLPRKGATT